MLVIHIQHKTGCVAKVPWMRAQSARNRTGCGKGHDRGGQCYRRVEPESQARLHGGGCYQGAVSISHLLQGPDGVMRCGWRGLVFLRICREDSSGDSQQVPPDSRGLPGHLPPSEAGSGRRARPCARPGLSALGRPAGPAQHLGPCPRGGGGPGQGFYCERSSPLPRSRGSWRPGLARAWGRGSATLPRGSRRLEAAGGLRAPTVPRACAPTSSDSSTRGASPSPSRAQDLSRGRLAAGKLRTLGQGNPRPGKPGEPLRRGQPGAAGCAGEPAEHRGARPASAGTW